MFVGRLEYANLEKQQLHEKILELQKNMGDLDADYKMSVDEKDSATKEALDNVKKISRLESRLAETTKENMDLQVTYCSVLQSC